MHHVCNSSYVNVQLGNFVYISCSHVEKVA